MIKVEIKNLSKTFNKGEPNEIQALRDVSLEVSANEILFILGTNGSGKSTLINLISGLSKPDNGEVLIDGRSIGSFSESERADIFGRLYQNPKENVLPSYTLNENISLAMNKNKETSFFHSLFSNQKEKQIANYLLNFAQDIIPMRNSLAHTLSGGQMQLLGLVNMLISNPKVLLLDEFTSALDVRNSATMLNMVQHYVRQNDNCAIIVSHNITQAFEFGTRIVLLHKGRMIKVFNPKRNNKSEVTEQFYKLDREEF